MTTDHVMNGGRRHRICFISMEVYSVLRPGSVDRVGGAGFQLVALARELRDRGYDIGFVVGDFGQPAHERIDGFDVWRSNRVTHDRSKGRGVANLFRLFRAMQAARADTYVLRSTRYLAGACWLYSRLLGERFVFMVANMDNCQRDSREGVPPGFNWWYRTALRRSDLVTSQTAEQRQLLREQFGVEARTVVNGIRIPEFEGPPASVDYDVLWVGTLKQVKRPDRLVAVARQLPEVQFAVVGGAGRDAPYSKRVIASFSSCTNLHYQGFVPPDRMDGWYGRTRLLLNTSDNEGFPNTFLSAWTRGVPTFSLGVDPDGLIARHGLGAVVESTSGLSRAIEGLLADRTAYEETSRRCYELVSWRHSVSRSADAFLAAMSGGGVGQG
jgi:glycosyltransferase involved in cell wall biosynthesis